MKEKIGNVVLNYQYYSGRDLYSDGPVEEELLEIVQSHKEQELNQIIAGRKSWSILYHLSHVRSNIIESIPIGKQDRVLEIGAGCGAITGKLAQKAKQVTCIELSKQRSLINANRNEQYDNIEILVGNFQDIERELDDAYDYVTLIGVFEYAQNYITAEDAYGAFLKLVMSHVKKGGQLVVAIENKLGLKYWAGCREDHIGTYYEGLEGYPRSEGVRTFSKKEWEAMLKQAGYTDYRFYYPYPDYKFPLVLYSDEYLPKCGELNNNRMNLDRDCLELFDESRVYDTIIREGLYPEFANSFLITIHHGE
ncbi:MAG: class I SAM-dependent methyltransferase [Lachnospiraceae bacterium]|nr:class I SAM-dependent methyltransferase [Lachnospiraceae bacterium]